MTDDDLYDHLRSEQCVFAELVEETLQSREGLRYEVVVPTEAPEDVQLPYAAFKLATDPAQDLTVSIELANAVSRLVINDIPFRREITSSKRFDKFIDHRCREIEQLVHGDIKLEHETFGGRIVSTTLSLGRDKKWREFGEHETFSPIVSLFSMFLPFFLGVTSSKERIYADWIADGVGEVDVDADGDVAPV